jgi:hypothetical protein
MKKSKFTKQSKKTWNRRNLGTGSEMLNKVNLVAGELDLSSC